MFSFKKKITGDPHDVYKKRLVDKNKKIFRKYVKMAILGLENMIENMYKNAIDSEIYILNACDDFDECDKSYRDVFKLSVRWVEMFSDKYKSKRFIEMSVDRSSWDRHVRLDYNYKYIPHVLT